jgi:uncharacterized protein (DUF362 family)
LPSFSAEEASQRRTILKIPSPDDKILREKVILRKVPGYNPEFIQGIIAEGMEDLGIREKARGKITIKPNVVMAHHKLAPSAFTRAEFLDGLIGAVRKSSGGSAEVSLAEKSGVGLPTSRMFRRAGYIRLKKRHKIKLLPLEEHKKTTLTLSRASVQKTVTTGESIVDNDFLVYTPKLKSNVLSHGLTAALKLNIGILMDRERMQNHNYNLDLRIADLLEVGYPDFIATDAVEIALGGNQMTQHGQFLGLVILATNPVAHDTVCAYILNLDPKKIPYLIHAHDRGYGPIDVGEIELCGDVSLRELQEKTRAWDNGLKRIDRVDSNMNILCGKPYCAGGCHGVFLDWLYMIKDRKPKLWKKLPAWTVIIGKYQGNIRAKRIMKIGTCTEIQGKVLARRKTKIRGCPPKHKKLILHWIIKAGILNPLLQPDMICDAYLFLFLSWCKRLVTGKL